MTTENNNREATVSTDDPMPWVAGMNATETRFPNRCSCGCTRFAPRPEYDRKDTPMTTENENRETARAAFVARHPEGLNGKEWKEFEAGYLAALSSRPSPATDEAYLEGLRVAMLGTTDGDFIDPNSEIPAGEMYRLAAEYVTLASRPSSTPTPAADEIVKQMRRYLERFDGGRGTVTHSQRVTIEAMQEILDGAPVAYSPTADDHAALVDALEKAVLTRSLADLRDARTDLLAALAGQGQK